MIKGLIFRLIILIVIATGIFSYVASLNGIDIRHFLPTFDNSQLPSLKLPAMPDIKLPGSGDENQQPVAVRKIYQWRGGDGSWHFSENLPEGTTAEKVIFLDAKTNVVESLPRPHNIKPAITVPNEPAPTASGASYNNKTTDKLLNDVQNTQRTLDQRKQQLEQDTPGP